MGILKSTAAYFALVFGAGFLFGTIRVPLLVPRFGERVAVLIETPFLLVAIILGAVCCTADQRADSTNCRARSCGRISLGHR